MSARLTYAPVVPIVFLFIIEQIMHVRTIDNTKTTHTIYIPPCTIMIQSIQAADLY